MGPASSSSITVVAAWVAARALSPATRTPASAPPFSCMRRYGTMSAMVELTPPAGAKLSSSAGVPARIVPSTIVCDPERLGASRATGESWERLVRSRVTAPPGMGATVLSYRDYLDAPNRSGSQTMGNGTMRAGTPADDDVFAPAAGVSATIADMVPYLRMQLNGGALAGVRVAGDKALAATHAATTVIDDDDEAGPTAYALGWETYGYLGRRVVQHGGDFSAGVSTMISMMPADGVGIVVLTNAFPEGHALAAALTKTLYDLSLAGEPQADWLREQHGLLLPQPVRLRLTFDGEVVQRLRQRGRECMTLRKRVGEHDDAHAVGRHHADHGAHASAEIAAVLHHAAPEVAVRLPPQCIGGWAGLVVVVDHRGRRVVQHGGDFSAGVS